MGGARPISPRRHAVHLFTVLFRRSLFDHDGVLNVWTCFRVTRDGRADEFSHTWIITHKVGFKLCAGLFVSDTFRSVKSCRLHVDSCCELYRRPSRYLQPPTSHLLQDCLKEGLFMILMVSQKTRTVTISRTTSPLICMFHIMGSILKVLLIWHPFGNFVKKRRLILIRTMLQLK